MAGQLQDPGVITLVYGALALLAALAFAILVYKPSR
jgi:hypothetical protein